MKISHSNSHSPYIILFLAFLALALLVRLIAILVSPLDIGPDEAQYWRWAQEPAFGYYSKPPLIAWVIFSTTSLFGNSEWAIRISVPILHTVSAVALFGLGKSVYGERVGSMAAIGYLLMPGVIVSSAIISTDGVLLPFFCGGLYFLWKLRSEQRLWLNSLGLGLCIGLGMLAKYAMIYFVIGTVLVAIFDKPTRSALLRANGLLIIILSLLIIAPHVFWNATNQFQTVGHTVDNANLGGTLLNFENILRFLIDQMGVFGPISFLILIAGILFTFRTIGRESFSENHWLLCFVIPVLTIVFVQAVISRANANWAATAYPAASVLIAAWVVRANPSPLIWRLASIALVLAILFTPGIPSLVKIIVGILLGFGILALGLKFSYQLTGFLWTGFGLHLMVAIALTAISIGPISWSENLGLANSFKRVRGWEETASLVLDAAKSFNATAIMVDEREYWHGLDYYLREVKHPPLYSWRRFASAKSFAEYETLNDQNDDRVLIASKFPDMQSRVLADFEQSKSIGFITVGLGSDKKRVLNLFYASKFAPLERNEDWELGFNDSEAKE